MKKLVLLASSALVLAACAEEPETSEAVATENAAPDAPAPTAASAVPASGQQYAEMASASDLFEIESAQLALERTQDSGVREFAQMLVTDHQKSTAALREAAGQADPPVTVNPQLTPAQQSDMEALRAADDTQFDQRFLEGQIKAHQKALAMLRGYAEQGDVESLARHASETAGPVEQHLEHARKLQNAPS